MTGSTRFFLKLRKITLVRVLLPLAAFDPLPRQRKHSLILPPGPNRRSKLVLNFLTQGRSVTARLFLIFFIIASEGHGGL